MYAPFSAFSSSSCSIVFFDGVKGCPKGALDLFKDGKLRTVNTWFEDSANCWLFQLHE
jgi:hypothetical protein